jgi:hypothetical protein
VRLAPLALLLGACFSSEAPPLPPSPCDPAFRYESGGDGHADPFGAKAAHQARAGRIRELSQIVQSPFARQRARIGDFAIANDKITAYIEAEGRASGYAPFGGDLVSIEPVGDDGRPLGVSRYNETLIALSRQTVKPDKVSVIADGEDGKAAIVRVSGVLVNIPFLDTFAALSPAEYGFPAAIDWVLEPGSEKLLYRLSFANTRQEPVDFANLERLGFFQGSQSKTFTEGGAFGPASGFMPWVAFDSGESAFLFRTTDKTPIRAELEISGFQLFSRQGLRAEACEKKTVDYYEIVTGAPGIDGLLEAKRRVDGEAPWRELHGIVREEGADALAGAWVHALAADGRYLTRAMTDVRGAFSMHVPPGAVTLTPTLQGWSLPPATPVTADANRVELVLPKRATIQVNVTDAATGEALPARIQVLPKAPVRALPPAFGIREETAGRLWQEFTMTGRATLPVPPGDYRVIVSRGYEYEMIDTPVAAPAVVDAKLRRSVDTTGVMCADFHIHSFFSADSSDPALAKVKGAIADGLDIPVSSEHEYVIDFQPIIERLGATKWAFGMPSSELTTFGWGHFGVVPLYPRDFEANNGAIDWVGKKPAEFFAQVNALPEKPVLIVNHPSGGNQGYFTIAGFDRATGRGSPDLWSDAFGAIEVFNDSDFETNRDRSVADWFALLDAGHDYWAVGSSDSHDQRTSHVGYPRTCLQFGHDDPRKLTAGIVRDVLRSGAATISGGLYMTVEPHGSEYEVLVQSPSWISATSLEVIVDGVTTQTIPFTVRPYRTAVTVAPTQSRARHWVVFHAKGAGDLAPLHPDRKPFAVSNPIFF